MRKLTLWMGTYIRAPGNEPDGTVYTTEEAARAAITRVLREELVERFGDEPEDEIEELLERFEADTLADLDDEDVADLASERLSVVTAVYETTVDLDEPDPAELADTVVGLVAAAETVVERWSTGDLAGAVNGLEGEAEAAREAFPDLDYLAEGEEDEDGDDSDDAPEAPSE